MNRVRCCVKYVSCFMTLIMVLISMPVQTAYAAMVGTETVLTTIQAQKARRALCAFIERKEVQDAMIAQGISPIEAKARVSSLSDAEVMRISDKMDKLPAGGDALSTLIGLAVLVFIVLLFTDLLGLTDIFPFIKHHSKK